MQYQYLSVALQPTAAAAIAHFKSELGLSSFKAEQKIHHDIGFGPTLHTVSKNHHIVCVEVSDRVYPGSLDAFVLKCKNLGLPVLLYVVFPGGLSQAEFKAGFQQAKENGVGVIEIVDGKANMMSAPLSLSLTGVRRISSSDFPAKYRLNLNQAQHTFLGGNPAKGCADIYDEIEALCRKISLKVHAKGYWRDAAKVPKLNLETGAWAKVVEVMKDHIDLKKTGCPNLNEALYYRILGITTHRNETGHKPSSTLKLQKRDIQLRTRFEHAADIFLEVVHASVSLRV